MYNSNIIRFYNLTMLLYDRTKFRRFWRLNFWLFTTLIRFISLFHRSQRSHHRRSHGSVSCQHRYLVHLYFIRGKALFIGTFSLIGMQKYRLALHERLNTTPTTLDETSTTYTRVCTTTSGIPYIVLVVWNARKMNETATTADCHGCL